MGISIDGIHGARSAHTLANLGRQLAHTLPGHEWREIAYLFDGRLADVASITPRDASRISDVLHKAARHPAMDADWGSLAEEIGDAANRAAASGRNWNWS